MSVPKSKRSKSKLQVITKSRLLAVYTLKITENEKNFPKRHRSFVRNKLQEVAMEISSLIYEANTIRVTIADDYKSRRALQQEALRLTFRLLNNIGIWHQIRRIDANRITYWSELIMETQSLLRSWRDSDAKRYRDILAQGNKDGELTTQ